MEINRIVKNIRKKTWFRNHSFRKSSTTGLQDLTTPQKDNYFRNKNVAISGEFFPMRENALKENLLKREANLQPEMTPETEILICGKYPNWILIEEARLYGIKIIFVDKAGELFSRIATKPNNNRSLLTFEEHLGV